MIQFFIPMKKIPTATHQQKQVTVVNGKPRFYEPDNVKAARARFMSLIGPHAPKEPLNAPIQIVMKWLYPVTRNSGNGDYKITRPDLDNMQKLVMDCMTDLKFWNDDSHVSSMIVEKFHSNTVGLYFEIKEL